MAAKNEARGAHAAGFALHLEGYGPPNLPEGFFDSLKQGLKGPCFLLFQTFYVKNRQ